MEIRRRSVVASQYGIRTRIPYKLLQLCTHTSWLVCTSVFTAVSTRGRSDMAAIVYRYESVLRRVYFVVSRVMGMCVLLLAALLHGAQPCGVCVPCLADSECQLNWCSHERTVRNAAVVLLAAALVPPLHVRRPLPLYQAVGRLSLSGAAVANYSCIIVDGKSSTGIACIAPLRLARTCNHHNLIRNSRFVQFGDITFHNIRRCYAKNIRRNLPYLGAYLGLPILHSYNRGRVAGCIWMQYCSTSTSTMYTYAK